MKIIKTPKKAKKKPTNVYVATIEFMSGDADHYAFEDYKFKTDEALLKAYKKISEIQNGGTFDWDLEQEYGFAMARDIMTDGQCFASLEGVKIVWYNENGKAFDVEIK